jgi:pimeloyl-ACP methyl ester carboxylesterase
MSRPAGAGRKAGLLGAAVGVLAAGAAAGFAMERYTVGRAFRRIKQGDEPFGTLRGEELRIETEDGVGLHVEVEGPADAPLSVLFCHGWALCQDCWHFQRRDLGDVGRLVFFDQRGHGRSGRGERETANIDQLGRDLLAVLDAVAPSGPVVLIGHSMGGMTIMALADQCPELFGDRVVGVALIDTSSGKLAEVTLGIPWLAGKFLGRVRPRVFDAVSRKADIVERSRRAGTDLSYVLTKKFSFSPEVDPHTVRFAAAILESTPIDVVADFYPALHDHDKLAALPVLTNVETLVLVGEKDLLTPADHSREIAREVPRSTLVVVPEGGHLVFMEHYDAVNEQIRDLCARAIARSRIPREGPAA